jgi:hypothetical protein
MYSQDKLGSQFNPVYPFRMLYFLSSEGNFAELSSVIGFFCLM